MGKRRLKPGPKRICKTTGLRDRRQKYSDRYWTDRYWRDYPVAPEEPSATLEEGQIEEVHLPMDTKAPPESSSAAQIDDRRPSPIPILFFTAIGILGMHGAFLSAILWAIQH